MAQTRLDKNTLSKINFVDFSNNTAVFFLSSKNWGGWGGHKFPHPDHLQTFTSTSTDNHSHSCIHTFHHGWPATLWIFQNIYSLCQNMAHKHEGVTLFSTNACPPVLVTNLKPVLPFFISNPHPQVEIQLHCCGKLHFQTILMPMWLNSGKPVEQKCKVQWS